ncbi:MAG: hypothetical protein ACOCXN_05915 [Spirochaetota bacterium]
MNRTMWIASVFFVCCVAAHGQEHYLFNETGATLYVTEDVEPDRGYRQVPADGVLPISGAAALSGFSFRRGSFSLPTFELSAEEVRGAAATDDGGRTYVRIRTEALSSERVVAPSEFESVLAEPRVDDQYLDWVGREAALARGRSRAPLGVFTDLGGGREAIALEDSLLWGRGGTDLQWLKSYAAASDYFVAVSVYSELAPGTSFFVYIYEPGGTVPVGTIEFPTSGGDRRSDASLVLLWLPGQPRPFPVGNMVASGLFFEAQVWRARLEEYLGRAPADLQVEVATASSAAGAWEEFVLSRDRFSAVFGE